MTHDVPSRRSFLRTTAAAIAGTTLARRIALADDLSSPTTAPSSPDPLYAFVLLGDLHYDKPEHHDLNWVRSEKGDGDVHQITGYCDVTARHTPRLFDRVRQTIAASRVPVPFVVQVGDLVEGLCGSYDLQAQQFRDATAAVDSARLGAPFLMCKGNHDITGPGAAEAYDRVLLPWLSKQAGSELTSAAFVRRHADDLFVFFDAYKPDLDFLADAFKAHADARHTFFVAHEPVVPYDDRSNWILFGAERDRSQRQHLLSMLGRRRAIVLGGHIHKYSLLERQTDAGSFPQLAVCSVVRSDKPQPNNVRDGAAAYTDDLVNLEPKFSPKTLDDRRRILQSERPAIRRYEYADLPGYAVVHVYADRVTCDIFAGAAETPWRSRQITGTHAST